MIIDIIFLKRSTELLMYMNVGYYNILTVNFWAQWTRLVSYSNDWKKTLSISLKCYIWLNLGEIENSFTSWISSWLWNNKRPVKCLLSACFILRFQYNIFKPRQKMPHRYTEIENNEKHFFLLCKAFLRFFKNALVFKFGLSW